MSDGVCLVCAHPQAGMDVAWTDATTRWEATMARCDVCGNDYDKAFEVVDATGSRRTFDSFECAIHLLAPLCQHCGCRVIGHGAEVDGRFFCCAHCARHGSASVEVQDRSDTHD